MLGELLKSSTVGLGIYPVISLIIFVTVFLLATWRMLKMDKSLCEEMAAMPLDNDTVVKRDLEE
jgi:hypothetical protein